MEDNRAAAAPTPVEPTTKAEYHIAEDYGFSRRDVDEIKLAESQRVERAQPATREDIEAQRQSAYKHGSMRGERQATAQPVEGPRCKCGREMVRGACASYWEPLPCCAPAPVEGVERVTDDAPARVEPTCDCRCTPCQKGQHEYCNHGCAEYGQATDKARERFNSRLEALPAAQPAKHTDDRPAETIPWRDRHNQLEAEYHEWEKQQRAAGILWSKIPCFSEWVYSRLGRAETRIEVLEAALRKVSRYHHDTCDQMLSPEAGYACSCGKAEADAALADGVNAND